ncbi:hypothetical protein D3C84_1139580 [compost metagenome]
MHLGARSDGVQARLQALEGTQQLARRAVERILLQHVCQLTSPQPFFQLSLVPIAQQLFQAGVGAALGDEGQGVAVGPGDFEVFGQRLTQ